MLLQLEQEVDFEEFLQVELQPVEQPPEQVVEHPEQLEDLEVPEQLPEQVVEQYPEQVVEHPEQLEDLEVPKQLELHDEPVQPPPFPSSRSSSSNKSSSSLIQEIIVGNAETPTNIGNVFFTTFLKKALRLIESSFIFFLN